MSARCWRGCPACGQPRQPADHLPHLWVNSSPACAHPAERLPGGGRRVGPSSPGRRHRVAYGTLQLVTILPGPLKLLPNGESPRRDSESCGSDRSPGQGTVQSLGSPRLAGTYVSSTSEVPPSPSSAVPDHGTYGYFAERRFQRCRVLAPPPASQQGRRLRVLCTRYESILRRRKLADRIKRPTDRII